MTRQDDLINSLSQGLQPVRPAPDANLLALAWLLLSSLYVIAITHWLGPLRGNALAQLAAEPRFLLETLTGVAAIVLTALLAFRAAVPGALSLPFAYLAAGLMLLWLSNYVVGLAVPALEPSMLGKREHCFAETLFYAVPPIVLGFALLRRLYPLRPLRTAMAISLAAGMLPALYMQLACMYDPAHILQFHILPGLLMVCAGAALAAVLKR